MGRDLPDTAPPRAATKQNFRRGVWPIGFGCVVSYLVPLEEQLKTSSTQPAQFAQYLGRIQF